MHRLVDELWLNIFMSWPEVTVHRTLTAIHFVISYLFQIQSYPTNHLAHIYSRERMTQLNFSLPKRFRP